MATIPRSDDISASPIAESKWMDYRLIDVRGVNRRELQTCCSRIKSFQHQRYDVSTLSWKDDQHIRCARCGRSIAAAKYNVQGAGSSIASAKFDFMSVIAHEESGFTE